VGPFPPRRSDRRNASRRRDDGQPDPRGPSQPASPNRLCCSRGAARDSLRHRSRRGGRRARGGDGTRLVDVTEPECTSVSTALVHEHLPVLSEAGLVEYDAEATEVALATDAPQLRIDWVVEGPLADVSDLVRRPTRRDRCPDSSGASDGATAESTAADVPVPTASAANGDRMLWTLSRPRAERSAASESSSSREITSLLGESSVASDQQDGPST